MTPEELIAEEKELQEDRTIYPPFLVEEFRKGREEIRMEEKTGSSVAFEPTKITDFLQLIRTTWIISNKDYQERFWVRQELPMRGDTFSESTMTFEDTAEGILDPYVSIRMTKKQRAMLTQLFHLVEDYKNDRDTPCSRYGEKDEEIVNDPRWDKIRVYTKDVYQELIIEG
ncbi:MAG: hypothetical protein KFB95_04475 [Simkaniaceae bacterium]|nr:MAG: hypothetical protein KFB95_04475 [Simkaniaceae bacterium]